MPPGRTLTTMHKSCLSPTNPKPHRRNQQEKAQRTPSNNPENPSIRRIPILTNTPSCIRPDRYGNCGAAIGRRRGHPESVPTNPGGPSHVDGSEPTQLALSHWTTRPITGGGLPPSACFHSSLNSYGKRRTLPGTGKTHTIAPTEGNAKTAVRERS